MNIKFVSCVGAIINQKMLQIVDNLPSINIMYYIDIVFILGTLLFNSHDTHTLNKAIIVNSDLIGLCVIDYVRS